MEVVIFPGKGMPLKRYRPYFLGLKLRLIEEGEKPNVIIAHSRGFIEAIEYCKKHEIKPRILALDGSRLPEGTEMPDGWYIVFYFPVPIESDMYCLNYISRDYFDRRFYFLYIPYFIEEKYRHHPYMIKKYRDDMVNKILLPWLRLNE